MSEKRILVVEDERIVAEDLQNLLKRLGYVPLGPAASGREAIQMAADTHPDLVLMDVNLDGPMNGVQASMAIVEHRPVPVVYITAYPGTFICNSCEMVQPFLCAVKPFSASAIKAVVESAFAFSAERVN